MREKRREKDIEEDERIGQTHSGEAGRGRTLVFVTAGICYSEQEMMA